MAIVINGSGTVTGISVGGLPDGIVDAGTVAADVATQAELDAAGFDPDGAQVFNETGADVDFRVESDVNANTLFIDGATGSIGMGILPEDDLIPSRIHLRIGAATLVSKDTTANSQCTLSGNAKQVTTVNTSGWEYMSTDVATQYHQFDGIHYFKVAASGTANTAITWTTAMNINNSGNIGMGRDAAAGTTLEIRDTDNASAAVMALDSSSYSSGTVYLVRYRVNDSTKGSVTSNGSSVAFNTSSDYRLKENVDYDWDATTRLKQLKPARFNWIADDTNTLVDGFIAHEVSSIVPEAISGEKDAMTDVVLYVEGDELPEGKSVGDVKKAAEIDSQGIDQSKLVPLLVKTIQELEARITALEA